MAPEIIGQGFFLWTLIPVILFFALAIWVQIDTLSVGLNVRRDGEGNSLIFPSTESPIASANPAETKLQPNAQGGEGLLDDQR